ncbi:protein BEAN1 isoform X2 [Ranitomeya variabilis]|uniref:protein BEAN1 isoform X2 n=1 Tax=Ranitomeya variabilis TaxID=490064 RepID=UPI004057BBBE
MWSGTMHTPSQCFGGSWRQSLSNFLNAELSRKESHKVRSRMKSNADRQRLYQDYIAHYESTSHEGNVTLCDPPLQCRGDAHQCRGDAHQCNCPAALGENYSQLIRQNLQSEKLEHKVEALKQMMKGFAILELICVNLFLFPWRKEIRTLKKFTGTFVYFIQPVIPEDAIRQILQRVGYSIVSKTEYTIGGKINSEEAKQTAFDLYLSRIQCDNMLWRLNEDKSVSVSLLVHGPGHEAKHRSDPTGQTGKDTREPGEMQNLDLKSNDPSNDDPIKAVGMTVTSTSSQDDISDLSEEKPRYYTKRMDSDEFLYNYSDLNLAQQPIFPLYIKPKKWVAPVSEELNFVKPDGSAKNEGRELAEKITYDLQGNNIDITTFTEQLDPPKSLVSNESPAEVIAPTKQERVVSKLKMLNMSGESLTYPIEETVPPDSAKFSEGSDLGKIEVKWAFLTTKEGTESFASPMSPSSDFSMLNISGKPPIWTPGTDNRLREPPNSTYIPPRAPENEGMRLPNIKAEENHFQVSSPTGDALLVNEYNIHEDTKEDYVMITKKDQN